MNALAMTDFEKKASTKEEILEPSRPGMEFQFKYHQPSP